jgi:hypothetical protein
MYFVFDLQPNENEALRTAARQETSLRGDLLFFRIGRCFFVFAQYFKNGQRVANGKFCRALNEAALPGWMKRRERGVGTRPA